MPDDFTGQGKTSRMEKASSSYFTHKVKRSGLVLGKKSNRGNERVPFYRDAPVSETIQFSSFHFLTSDIFSPHVCTFQTGSGLCRFNDPRPGRLLSGTLKVRFFIKTQLPLLMASVYEISTFPLSDRNATFGPSEYKHFCQKFYFIIVVNECVPY